MITWADEQNRCVLQAKSWSRFWASRIRLVGSSPAATGRRRQRPEGVQPELQRVRCRRERRVLQKRGQVVETQWAGTARSQNSVASPMVIPPEIAWPSTTSCLPEKVQPVGTWYCVLEIRIRQSNNGNSYTLNIIPVRRTTPNRRNKDAFISMCLMVGNFCTGNTDCSLFGVQISWDWELLLHITRWPLYMPLDKNLWFKWWIISFEEVFTSFSAGGKDFFSRLCLHKHAT